ncbi:MAG: hypothetical protein C0402_11395 [Thermodesulfovibrio sp.]|nr:hypothetical protein [Thermodesulfovibrio sp.]
MKRINWYMLLALSLVLLSSVIYSIQILVFRKTEDTFFYMLQDIAFVPIQVLIVSLIIERLLNEREKTVLLKKMNMLVGAFYSEVGSGLMKRCSRFSTDLSELSGHLLVTPQWSAEDFARARFLAGHVNPHLDSRSADLSQLKIFLEGKRGFLLSLLANPNLLEHDAFTDLLWAVFHLLEELTSRDDFSDLPRADYDHLSGDMKRAFTQLLAEWLSYMQHLKQDYPYLFSLAVRVNPMDPKATAVIEG